MNLLDMPNLNTRLFEFVNNAVGYYRPLDVLFIIATSFYTLVVVGIVVIYYMGFYVPMKQKGITHIQTLKHMGMVVLSLAVTFVTVSIIKVAVAFPRPFKTLPNLHVLISLPTDYSFPSGHAALTMALATAVYCYHKRLGEVLFAFALIVGLARVYVGVHYPLDVGVGFLLGYLIPKLLQHYFIKKESLKLQ
jgi:undecaprenyl-diphosphatase